MVRDAQADDERRGESEWHHARRAVSPLHRTLHE